MSIELKAIFNYEKADPSVGAKEDVEIIRFEFYDPERPGLDFPAPSTIMHNFILDNYDEYLKIDAFEQVGEAKHE